MILNSTTTNYGRVDLILTYQPRDLLANSMKKEETTI